MSDHFFAPISLTSSTSSASSSELHAPLMSPASGSGGSPLSSTSPSPVGGSIDASVRFFAPRDTNEADRERDTEDPSTLTSSASFLCSSSAPVVMDVMASATARLGSRERRAVDDEGLRGQVPTGNDQPLVRHGKSSSKARCERAHSTTTDQTQGCNRSAAHPMPSASVSGGLPKQASDKQASEVSRRLWRMSRRRRRAGAAMHCWRSDAEHAVAEVLATGQDSRTPHCRPVRTLARTQSDSTRSSPPHCSSMIVEWIAPPSLEDHLRA